METILLLGALVLIVFLILIICFIISTNRKKKENKVIEQYLIQGWNAVGKNDNLKAREAYEKIRTAYKPKNDTKGKLMKRIKLFYSKISGQKPQTKSNFAVTKG